MNEQSSKTLQQPPPTKTPKTPALQPTPASGRKQLAILTAPARAALTDVTNAQIPPPLLKNINKIANKQPCTMPLLDFHYEDKNIYSSTQQLNNYQMNSTSISMPETFHNNASYEGMDMFLKDWANSLDTAENWLMEVAQSQEGDLADKMVENFGMLTSDTQNNVLTLNYMINALRSMHKNELQEERLKRIEESQQYKNKISHLEAHIAELDLLYRIASSHLPLSSE